MTATRPMKASCRKVLDVFAAHGFGWVSGNVLLEAHCGRYSARLYDLREWGWEHETRPVVGSSVPMYRLYRPEPEQLRLEGIA